MWVRALRVETKGGSQRTLLRLAEVDLHAFRKASRFQQDYRHTSDRLQVLLAYTYSKAMDNASGYGEQMNPINPRISRGLSAFDATNNFTVNYNSSLPIDKWLRANRPTRG